MGIIRSFPIHGIKNGEFMKNRRLKTGIILLLAVQLLFIGILLYERIGYEPFEKLTRKEIEKYTYTLGEHEFEYELPDRFYSYVHNLKIYIPYHPVSFLYNTTYGTNMGVLKVYLKNGEIHTIWPTSGRSFFGRDMFVVRIDGKAYLTDAWYGISLAEMLNTYSDERKEGMKGNY